MTETRTPQNPAPPLPPGVPAAHSSSANAPDASPADGPEIAEEMPPQQKRLVIGLIIFVLLLVISTVAGIWFLYQPTTPTDRIRDIFIILMAIQSLFIGLVLAILMVQLARLINLLQNEIKPILDSTNETVSHLRGTTAFLSDNLTEPVIKLNEYLAGLSQFFYAIGLVRKSSRSKSNNPPKGE